MLRLHVQTGMFVCYELDRGAQGSEIVDVFGIGVDCVGKSLRLVHVHLVGFVEDVFQARIFC